MGTLQWKRTYDDRGYLVVADILSPQELREIREASDQIVTQAAQLRESNAVFQLEKVGGSPKAVVKRIFDPITVHECYRSTMRHPGILEVVTTLLGPNVEFHHSKAHLKQPEHGSKIDWHRDFTFFPHTNFDLLAVMIAIDDSTPENGCLRVIRGSHRWPLVDPEVQQDGFMKAAESEIRKGDIENVRVPAGGISIHHCLLYHSSLPNRSNQPRRSLIHQFRAADALQLAGRTNHANYGVVVAGEPLPRARLVAAEFVLPKESTDPRDYVRG